MTDMQSTNEDPQVVCPSCDGTGDIECEGCEGGMMDCFDCDGSGEAIDMESNVIDCPECNQGRLDCEECGGTQEVACPTCDGDGTIDAV